MNANNEEPRKVLRRPRKKPAEYYQSDEWKQKHEEYKRQQELSRIQMTLDSSMRSQTKIIVKPTYKELLETPFIARITAQLEKNDHDGYCSDEDCKYTRKIVKTNIFVPEQYKDHPVGQIENTREYKWANHLPLQEVNIGGSMYCKFVKPNRGVGQHCYRYTIKNVEIVENKKYKGEAEEKAVIKHKKTQKNGYVVMASQGSYSDYENEPYGYSDTEEGAMDIAIEAVCYGEARDDKWDGSEGRFQGASICDLDTMKKVRLLHEEIEYYRERKNQEKPFRHERTWINYTKEEQDENLKELYDKMVAAKKRETRIVKETFEEMCQRINDEQVASDKVKKDKVKKDKIEIDQGLRGDPRLKYTFKDMCQRIIDEQVASDKVKKDKVKKDKIEIEIETDPRLKYTKEERKNYWEGQNPDRITKKKEPKSSEIIQENVSMIATGLTGFYNPKKECEILWNDEEEIKTNQIQISTQNNKNGYIILAQDGYDDYEVYGYTEKNEEAENIAKEAVKTGKQRLDYDEKEDEEDVYNKANVYYRSIIVDLDTRRTIWRS